MRTHRPRNAAWPRLAVWTVGLAAVVAAVVILRAGRGTNFFFDEWEWITRRRDASLDDFLRPHHGHFSAIPVAVYKVLFEVFRIRSYLPYRVVVLASHLTCCMLLFVYLRRRVADWYAVSATVVLLFLGYAWQDLLWAFQIGFLMAAAAGLAALLLLDRKDRVGDVGAAIALVVSLACAGIGLMFLGGVLIELLWSRADWRRLWIALVPLALYGFWYVGYGSSDGRIDNLGNAPGFVGDAAGSSAGGLLGVPLTPGKILAIGLTVIVVIAVVRTWPISGRFAATIAMPLAFWGLLAYTRADGYGTGAESRYIYIGGLFSCCSAPSCCAECRRPAGHRRGSWGSVRSRCSRWSCTRCGSTSTSSMTAHACSVTRPRPTRQRTVHWCWRATTPRATFS